MSPLDAPLDPKAVYLSPTGRRCRVFHQGSNPDRATLLYDLRNGAPAKQADFSEGFALTRENWPLLQKVSG
jgi:hypothetical protein